MKSTLAEGKVAASAAVFFIDWDDLQLNVPNPFVPGQFYIANVGGARSSGIELDVTARPLPSIDLFAALGITSAEFASGTMANGVAVEGKDLPYTPDYTAMFGGQLSRPITSTITGYGRAEFGTDRRVFHMTKRTRKARTRTRWLTCAPAPGQVAVWRTWIRNAFDTRYVPIAIPYPGFAPSGFIGETGRPRTFGISIGTSF